jgi:hypothetical protein
MSRPGEDLLRFIDGRGPLEQECCVRGCEAASLIMTVARSLQVGVGRCGSLSAARRTRVCGLARERGCCAGMTRGWGPTVQGWRVVGPGNISGPIEPDRAPGAGPGSPGRPAEIGFSRTWWFGHARGVARFEWATPCRQGVSQPWSTWSWVARFNFQVGYRQGCHPERVREESGRRHHQAGGRAGTRIRRRPGP